MHLSSPPYVLHAPPISFLAVNFSRKTVLLGISEIVNASSEIED